MRILVVSAYFETHRGGVERVAGALARRLAAAGQDATWLAGDASPPPDDPQGVQVIAMPASNAIEARTGLPVPLIGPSAVRILRRLVRESDVVIIHDTLYLAHIVAFMIARWSARPVIIVQHVGLIDYSNLLARLLMRLGDATLGRRMLTKADRRVFISERVAETYSRLNAPKPAEVIFNGVDVETFSPGTDSDRHSARTELDLGDGTVILFSGRFVERKGLGTIAKLAERHQNATFVLAGSGPINPEEWGLSNVRTVVAETREGMRDLYRAADLLVLPSYGEGFPLVVQEALATGLPVLTASETLAADQALGDWIAHAPVLPDDEERTARAWTDALTATLEDLAKETSATRAARASFAAGRYGWDQATERYLAIIADVTGSA